MAKPEWGLKRTCFSCSARFYDLRREPIICPICSTVYDPARQPRPRRSGGSVRDDAAAVPALVDSDTGARMRDKESLADDGGDADIEDLDDSAGDDGDVDDLANEEGEIIEDASELGEDVDDIGEVMEHVDDEMEDKA